MPTPTPTQRITPVLWFDDQAEEAAAFYTLDLPELQGPVHLAGPDHEKARQAMAAVLNMKELDLTEVRRTIA